jgi:hypothetical protein
LLKQHVNFQPNSTQNNLTIVTAFYDINRIGRPNSEYFKWLHSTFQVNNPFILFTQAKCKNDIIQLIPPNRTVLIVILELEDTPYYKDIDRVKQVMSSQQYRSRMHYPDRIECTNPFYSVVIFSKFTFLDIAVKINPFQSSRYLWMDAGMSRFFGDFDLAKPLTGRRIPDGQFVINLESRAYSDPLFKTKSNFLIWMPSNFIQAGIMGGTGSSIALLSYEMEREWRKMLKASVVNNEQVLMAFVLFRRPKMFHVYDKQFQTSGAWVEFMKYLL